MGELLEDPNILIYAAGILAVIVATPICHRIPRTRGVNPVAHAVFFAIAAASLLLVPDYIQFHIFNPGGVLVIGTIWPSYASIAAVCSIDEDDDTAWLQYWLASATFTYATEFMDVIAEHAPVIAEHWYELEFFVMLWLILPHTDGSSLIYDKLTEPYVAPVTQKLKSKLEGWVGVIATAVNTSYLWIIWASFVTLPEEARRFVMVVTGTVYPIIASTVAVTTKSDVSDDTYWLTYWPCFNLLFVTMDFLEEFVGQITGFYSLCLVATVYLFLPMFRGAEAVLRNVLVPLSGQYENMLLRDTWLLRREMEKKTPPAMIESLRIKAATVFLKGTDKEKKLE